MVDASVNLAAEFFSRNATTVGTSAAAAHDPILEPSQRSAFYAAGRRWVFYTDGTNLVFRSSADAVTWSADTSVRACVKGDQFAIHFDGTYVHYAYASPVAGASGGIWYRRGAPQSNGTITWSAVEQKPTEPGEPGNIFLTPSVSVDSSGYPWLVWVLYDSEGPTYRLYCVRSANNDGTWSGAEGGGSLAAGIDATTIPRLLPLQDRRMYCLWDESGDILGKLYSGPPLSATIWGSEEDTGADIAASRLYDAISYLDHVHLAWTETTTLKLQHRKRVYGTGWSASHEIYNAVLADMGPAISRGSQEPPKLYVFWAPDEANPTADHVFYALSTDDGVTWSAPVDWVDDSADTFPLANQQSVFEVQGEFYIGCMWVRSSPDDIRYYELEDDANASADLPAEFWVLQGWEDLPGEFIARHVGTPVELLASFEGQVSLDLLGKFVIQQEASEDLLAAFDGQVSLNLPGEFIVRQEASEDLLGEFVVRHVGTVELLGEFVVRHVGTVELLGAFVVRHEASENLLGELVVRHSGSADLAAELIVRHVGTPLNLLGALVVRQERSVNLLVAFVVRHVGTPLNLLGALIVRHVGTLDLPGEFIVRHTTLGALFAKFVVRHVGTPLNLSGAFNTRHEAAGNDVISKFAVRSVYPYWTDRRYVNGVIDAAEQLIGDAKLEFIIEGVMDDIKVWAEANTVSYDSWTNIEVTPTAIKRATTYGVVAALYARHTKTFQGQVIPTLAPVTVTVTGDQEKAMEHWEGRMDEMLQLYLTAQGFARIWISTSDEEPVFTMEDIPPSITSETLWLEWLQAREV